MSLRHDDVALLVEDHFQAAARAAWCQQALCRCLSHKVKARDLEKGDLVPRRIRSTKDKKQVDAEVGRPLPGNTSPPRDRRWHSGAKLMKY